MVAQDGAGRLPVGDGDAGWDTGWPDLLVEAKSVSGSVFALVWGGVLALYAIHLIGEHGDRHLGTFIIGLLGVGLILLGIGTGLMR